MSTAETAPTLAMLFEDQVAPQAAAPYEGAIIEYGAFGFEYNEV